MSSTLSDQTRFKPSRSGTQRLWRLGADGYQLLVDINDDASSTRTRTCFWDHSLVPGQRVDDDNDEGGGNHDGSNDTYLRYLQVPSDTR